MFADAIVALVFHDPNAALDKEYDLGANMQYTIEEITEMEKICRKHLHE